MFRSQTTGTLVLLSLNYRGDPTLGSRRRIDDTQDPDLFTGKTLRKMLFFIITIKVLFDHNIPLISSLQEFELARSLGGTPE